jgi:hypothetical protein
MSGSFSLMIAGVLLGMLALFVLKMALTAHALEQEPEDLPGEPSVAELCPAECAERIFSEDDRAFVWELKSPSVQRLFERERKAVALLWIRQMARGIRRVMREHAEAARRSADVRVGTEMRLFAQYGGSMLICGTLLFLTQLGGPLWLRGLAGYAQRLSQRMAEGQRAFAAAADSQAAG